MDRGSLTAGDFFAQAGWGGEGPVDLAFRGGKALGEVARGARDSGR